MGENMILSRLEGVKARFEEVGQLITDPSIISDMSRYVKLSREYKQLEPVVEALNAYKDILSNIGSAREMLAEEKDDELKEMARAITTITNLISLFSAKRLLVFCTNSFFITREIPVENIGDSLSFL